MTCPRHDGGCGCHFCGHCFADFGRSTPAHVLLQHGSYYGTYEQFCQSFGARATIAIRVQLAGAPARLNDLLQNTVTHVLEGNRYNIRPEHVYQIEEISVPDHLKCWHCQSDYVRRSSHFHLPHK